MYQLSELQKKCEEVLKRDSCALYGQQSDPYLARLAPGLKPLRLPCSYHVIKDKFPCLFVILLPTYLKLEVDNLCRYINMYGRTPGRHHSEFYVSGPLGTATRFLLYNPSILGLLSV